MARDLQKHVMNGIRIIRYRAARPSCGVPHVKAVFVTGFMLALASLPARSQVIVDVTDARLCAYYSMEAMRNSDSAPSDPVSGWHRH